MVKAKPKSTEPLNEKFTAIDIVFDKKLKKFYKVTVEYDFLGAGKVISNEELGSNQAIAMSKIQEVFAKKMMSLVRGK